MRNLLYIALMLVIAGCGLSASRHGDLDQVQHLIATDPQTALSRLNGMDVSQFDDSATMARWALLYSEAMAANHLSAPTDTIVDIAVSYYGSHNIADEYKRASKLKEIINRPGNDADALATALYLQKEKEFMVYKERTKREQLLIVGAMIFILAAGIIIWMRQRLRLKSARNEALMAEASALRCSVDAGRGEVSRLQCVLHRLLEKRFTLIDSLCQTYYESQGTKAERKLIADKVKSEIDAVRTDAFADMEQAVNDCRDNLLTRLRKAYPEIRPEEYQLAAYLASGLSARTISLLLGESIDVVYKRKSRLKKRLSQLSDPDFMSIF